ncbi:MAG: arsenate reductase ArsC [Candidatus Kapaibacterium sp.]
MNRPSSPAVLILCTGNSCRSQMAESMLRSMVPHARVFSAGVAPGPQVAPLAVKVLTNTGFPVDGLYPKHVREFDNQPMNLVLTVCNHAREQCPVPPAGTEHIHHGFDDPYHATGSDEEQEAVYERVRAEMEHWLRTDILPKLP